MAKALRVCACFVFFLSLAPPARAEWHITPFIGMTFGRSTTFPDVGEPRHRALGVTVARVGASPLGLEGVFVHVPGILGRDHPLILGSRTFAVMGNVFVTIPRSWSEHGLRPFVSGGAGLMNVAQTQLLDALPFGRNVLGYNVGGGAIGPLTDRTGVRFELRRYSYLTAQETQGFTIDPSCVTDCEERLSYWSASVGFVIRLR